MVAAGTALCGIHGHWVHFADTLDVTRTDAGLIYMSFQAMRRSLRESLESCSELSWLSTMLH